MHVVNAILKFKLPWSPPRSSCGEYSTRWADETRKLTVTYSRQKYRCDRPIPLYRLMYIIVIAFTPILYSDTV